MTVKELVEVMDKSTMFTVQQAGNDKLIFESTNWNKTNYTMKPWDDVADREVVQFTPNFDDDDVSVYVVPVSNNQ